MINWYGVQLLTFVLLSIGNFVLVLFSVIPIWTGLFIWIIGLPLIFMVISFILYKMEQKGYIHDTQRTNR